MIGLWMIACDNPTDDRRSFVETLNSRIRILQAAKSITIDS
jgi:hypothetical protein